MRWPLSSKGSSTPAKPWCTIPTHYDSIISYLVGEQLLPRVLAALDSSAVVHTLFALARLNRATWDALAGDHKLWRGVYVECDPLVTPPIRKRMLRDSYTSNLATTTLTLPRTGLQQSAWLRTCCLLYSKPRLCLVMGGRDPVIVRRLGQPEDEALVLNLGLNYHLDSYLDEDMERFAVEFPQCFQDLDFGDLVVTQDFKGAGLWTAQRNPDNPPFMRLKKSGKDSAGWGILGKDQAPPSCPLLYYCDAHLDDVAAMDRWELARRKLYWFSFTMLPDKSLFSWDSLEVLDAL